MITDPDIPIASQLSLHSSHGEIPLRNKWRICDSAEQN